MEGEVMREECNNQIVRFNLQMYGIFSGIVKELQKEIKPAQFAKYRLEFVDGKTYKIVELKDNKKMEVHSDYLDYFWVEFKYKNGNYKISMFYKDFDCETENIHVLPGAIQFWKKNDEKQDSEGGIGGDTVHRQGKRIVSYSEYGWEPILKSPLFVDTAKNENISVCKNIWDFCKGQIALNDLTQVYSNVFYNDVKPCEFKREECEKFKGGHYMKYALYKWITSGNEIVAANFEIYDCEGSGFFAKVGKIIKRKQEDKNVNKCECDKRGAKYIKLKMKGEELSEKQNI